MQRLFSMFPSGVAGVGLIALRFCVVASLWMALSLPASRALLDWPGICLVVLAGLIACGILTPLVCGLIVMSEGIDLVHHHGHNASATLLAIGLACVLAVLGPGAFSVDSILFARRRIFPDG